MSNCLINDLANRYILEGLSRREALNEAVETYREIRKAIQGAENQVEVLKQYGLGPEYLEDVL